MGLESRSLVGEKCGCKLERWLVGTFMGSAKSGFDLADSALGSLLFWSWYARRIESGAHSKKLGIYLTWWLRSRKKMIAIGNSMEEAGLSA